MSDWQSVGILAGSLISAGVILLMVVMHIRNRHSSSVTAAASNPRRPTNGRTGDLDDRDLAAARHVTDEIRELMEQLVQHSDQIDSRVELRVKELKRLLSQVDEAVTEADAKLKQLRTHGSGAGTFHRQPYPQQRPADGEAIRPPVEGEQEDLNPKHAEVLRLKSQGLDEIEIARRVDMNVGEVELVLGLHLSRPSGDEMAYRKNTKHG